MKKTENPITDRNNAAREAFDVIFEFSILPQI